MWLLPWNQNSDFYSQYEIGNHVVEFDGKSLWTLFHAKLKATQEACSIFRFDLGENNTNLIDIAKRSLKRLKTLRHPSVLKYINSYEGDKSICIVTEPVTPLALYLERAQSNFTKTQREFSISYGLLSVAKVLNFMNNDCQLNHNNINIHSIFVNSSGVWKIGGLEYVCSVDEQPPKRYNDLSEKYIPPERLEPEKVRHPGGKFAVDSWGMGCLVWESFNRPITENSSMKTMGKMPRPLGSHYNKLVQSSPRYRISPLSFVNESKEAGVFFNMPLLETILFLEEIQLVKDPAEKVKFFSRLESELESFPSDICNNKILTDLIYAFEYGDAGAIILDPIFKIGKSLDPSQYQKKLVPCIIKLYSCKDRATRSKLLQQLESHVEMLTPDVINNQIFPNIVQGLMDSYPMIREQTVKSMLHLAPRLSSTNLNDELLKHFTRLQARDEEGGIRANTIVCLGKIAKYFGTQTQQTILMHGFLRSLRDPFSYARHAAIAGLSANEAIFLTKDCATKIMPALCVMSIDPDVSVRKLAFKSLKMFMDRVQSEMEKDAVKKESETQGATATATEHIDEDIEILSIKN